MAKRKPELRANLNSNAVQTIYLVQYDTTELTCVVMHGDNPLDLSGMSVTLMAAYNNKVIATQTFVVTDSGNIITMGLSPAFVQYEGRVTMQLIFRDSASGDQISTYMFYASVAKNLLGCSPGPGAGDPPFVLGTSDYNDLTNKPTVNGKELVGDIKIKTAYDSAVNGGYTGDEETFDRILCVMAEIVTCLSDSHKYVLGSDD